MLKSVPLEKQAFQVTSGPEDLNARTDQPCETIKYAREPDRIPLSIRISESLVTGASPMVKIKPFEAIHPLQQGGRHFIQPYDVMSTTEAREMAKTTPTSPACHPTRD